MKHLIATSILLAVVLTALPVFAADSLSAESINSQAGQNDLMLAQYNFDNGEVWDDSGNIITSDSQAQAKDSLAYAPDPIEGWNRFWYSFNDKMYYYFWKPLAKGYGHVIPEKPRGWVRNFFRNLIFPVRFINCILQGKFEAAGLQTSKFIFNTTIGLGGLADVTEGRAKTRPMPDGEEDFGQTLGYWGMGNGMYLVWPFLGPSSIRDSIGFVGDYYATPQTYTLGFWTSMIVYAYAQTNKLSLEMGKYEALTESAVDPYQALRDAYLKMRAKKIQE